jgi:hypothetical protein
MPPLETDPAVFAADARRRFPHAREPGRAGAATASAGKFWGRMHDEALAAAGRMGVGAGPLRSGGVELGGCLHAGRPEWSGGISSRGLNLSPPADCI